MVTAYQSPNHAKQQIRVLTLLTKWFTIITPLFPAFYQASNKDSYLVQTRRALQEHACILVSTVWASLVNLIEILVLGFWCTGIEVLVKNRSYYDALDNSAVTYVPAISTSSSRGPTSRRIVEISQGSAVESPAKEKHLCIIKIRYFDQDLQSKKLDFTLLNWRLDSSIGRPRWTEEWIHCKRELKHCTRPHLDRVQW